MKTLHLLGTALAAACALTAYATPVRVTMNDVSRTMVLSEETTGININTGTPDNKTYAFNVNPGTYVLTAYGIDGATCNGSITLDVPDSAEEQEFSVLTNTVYATNSGWKADTDYKVEVSVLAREGIDRRAVVGNSVTAGRKTFLALKGNSYMASLIPSDTHQGEGFATLYLGGTVTSSSNVSGAIPMAGDFTVTLPADAWMEIGLK